MGSPRRRPDPVDGENIIASMNLYAYFDENVVQCLGVENVQLVFLGQSSAHYTYK